MTTVASRDLRNHTSEVLRRVAGGERVTITVRGLPVAELVPTVTTRRASLSRADLVSLLVRHRADAGLRVDLSALDGDATDDFTAPKP